MRNEGWASYWHARIMRELDLDVGETIEFAKLNANIVQPGGQQINPYYLGLKLLEDIEERYDHPTEEMKKNGVKEGSGLEKLFEVRALEWDQTFLRNYMTKDFVEKENLFMYGREGQDIKVTSVDWKDIRDNLVTMRNNGGYPYIVVEDGDYLSHGELYLKHNFEGVELDLKYLEKVLPYIHQLWGRTTHLQTIVEDHPILFSCDGEKVHRKRLD